jgi:hypothetical protein
MLPPASEALAGGHLSKFSLTATQALFYFDSSAPGDVVTWEYRLRAKYPIRARTFKSQVCEYYDPEIPSVAESRANRKQFRARSPLREIAMISATPV